MLRPPYTRQSNHREGREGHPCRAAAQGDRAASAVKAVLKRSHAVRCFCLCPRCLCPRHTVKLLLAAGALRLTAALSSPHPPSRCPTQTSARGKPKVAGAGHCHSPVEPPSRPPLRPPDMRTSPGEHP
jgi:hypothetical protein